jgi:putative DNA methylase
VKAEMSVATPKAQAKTPIRLDIIIVCRKQAGRSLETRPPVDDAIESARLKLQRLRDEGFRLSRNDRKIVMLGQLLTTLEAASDLAPLLERVETELDQPAPEEPVYRDEPLQRLLF